MTVEGMHLRSTALPCLLRQSLDLVGRRLRIELPAEDGRRRRPPAGPALKVVRKIITASSSAAEVRPRPSVSALLPQLAAELRPSRKPNRGLA